MATQTTDTYRDFSVQQAVTPGATVSSITNALNTNDTCRAVYVGVSDDYEFYVGGAWVVFKNATGGTVLPIRASGARHDSGDSAPDAGDIIFIY